jgi:hypothetical protein
MNYSNPASAVVLAALGLLNTHFALADGERAQPWSGYVEYERSSSLSGESDSTWMHATAIGTPTSHTTNAVSETLSATFILTRGETAIPVDIGYQQNATRDIASKAEIECRTPSGRHRASLNRRYSEHTGVSAAAHLPRGDVTVGFSESTGEYSVTVGAGDFEANGSAGFSGSEGGGCGNPPPASKTDLPPFTTTVSGFSARGKGKTRVERDKPIVLSGSYRVSKTETLTWNLSADPDNPPVAIHGPYRSVRGEAVTFDGTRSKGKELKYKWTFKAGSCSTDPSVREVTLEGPVVTATLLCNTEVTLEVSDDKKRTDKRTREVKVKPREWSTELARGETKYFVKPSYFDSDFHSLNFFPGANRCARHDDEEEGKHFLHPRPGEWEGGLYTLKEVKDGGPFDGMAYVDLVTNPIPVPRMAWLNADLLPTSWMAKENAKTKARAADFNTLVEQVKAHEATHTELIEEAMAKRDYAKELEFLVGKSREALNEAVVAKLTEAENALRDAALKEAEVKARLKRNYPQLNRSGMILVPVGDINSETFHEWKIANFAELGDE